MRKTKVLSQERQSRYQQDLKIFYGKLMDFENRLIADCGQGKSFEAGQYAGVVANLRKDIEVLLQKEEDRSILRLHKGVVLIA